MTLQLLYNSFETVRAIDNVEQCVAHRTTQVVFYPASYRYAFSVFVLLIMTSK